MEKLNRVTPIPSLAFQSQCYLLSQDFGALLSSSKIPVNPWVYEVVYVSMVSCPSWSQRNCWLDFVNLTQTQDTWEDGTPNEQFPPSDWAVSMSSRHFFKLLIEAGRPSSP